MAGKMDAQPSEKDSVFRWEIRVKLEPVPLEVLNQTPVLLERFACRIAEDRQAATGFPVAEKWTADRMLGLREILIPDLAGNWWSRWEGLIRDLNAKTA